MECKEASPKIHSSVRQARPDTTTRPVRFVE